MNHSSSFTPPSIPSSTIITPQLARHLSLKGIPIQQAWEWSPFQSRVLLSEIDEIALLGGKFGGKSVVSRGFLLKGNPQLSSFSKSGEIIPTNLSYVYHPNYRATILRRNEKDLDDFIRRFKQMAAPFGGDYKRGMFEFPSGAVIACGHLADKDAWQKYVGVENIRFVIEEAALIPDFELFDQVRSCCRTVWPELKPQILLTSNFGGPGTGWLIDRYIEVKDPTTGDPIPHDTVISETVAHPDFPEQTITKTRIWMFSTFRDNPHAAKDPGYIGTLATMKDDKLRAAYLEGDWRSMQGRYFSGYRPKGPLPGEPPNANHVIPANPVLLKPWWFRWGSIDVGYSHRTAVFWACRSATSHQIHVYREISVSETSYIQIGYEIACRSLPELELLPSHSMTFWVSHDALQNRTGERSIAELLMQGISRKLGPNAIHFPEFEIRKFRELSTQQFLNAHEEDQKWAVLLEKLKLQRRAGITLRVAPKDRIIGWQHVREALRFTPIGQSIIPFDRQIADRLYVESRSRWEAYMRIYQPQSEEILPALQIWSPTPDLGPLWGCPRLIESIPKAMHEEPPGNPEDVTKKHFTGSDECDSLRYLLMGFRESPQEEPYEEFRDRQISSFLLTQPSAAHAPGTFSAAPTEPNASDLIWINRFAEGQWRLDHDPAFSTSASASASTSNPRLLPSRADRRRRLMQSSRLSP